MLAERLQPEQLKGGSSPPRLRANPIAAPTAEQRGVSREAFAAPATVDCAEWLGQVESGRAFVK
jgi:hypothetical protein